MEDLLKKALEIYPEKPSMALWRACEMAAIRKVIENKGLSGSPRLDLGCGDGEIAEILFGKSYFDIGLDISYLEVYQAKEKGVYKRTIISDIYDNRLPGDFFNFIFSNSVIEHFPDLEKAFVEIYRLMKEDGSLLLTVPTDALLTNQAISRLLEHFGLKRWGKSYGSLRNRRLGHEITYSIKDWRRLIESNGFEIVEINTYLSPAATSWWDFCSYYDLLVRIFLPKPLFDRLPTFILNSLRNFWYGTFQGVFVKDLSLSGNHGSCVLILAKKRR